MKGGTLILLMLGLLFTDSLGYAEEAHRYPSPNRKYLALVIALPKAQYGSGESKIELRTSNGSILCAKNYGSEDGEHGFRVEHSAWTPDSQFFVYSMSSSGGHQAWHAPIYFIWVGDFKIRSLDSYVGSITDPNFKVSSPNIIKGISSMKGDLEQKPFKVKLTELVPKEGQLRYPTNKPSGGVNTPR